MADGTHISWADATWNVITGCMVTSPGCVPCYAMKLAGTRLKNHPSRSGLTIDTKAGPVWNGEVRFNEQWLDQPLRWRSPRNIFVVAHGDLFYERVPREWQVKVFDVVRAAKWHRMLILTKRPDIMWDVLVDHAPMPHVWLGCSVEDAERADQRYSPMRDLADHGWNTWVSYEPALGPVGWRGWSFLKWMVAGGQSDFDRKSAKPAHPQWFRNTRDWCLEHGIPFHLKQNGAWLHMPERAHFRDCYSEEWRRVSSEIDGVRPSLMFRVGAKAAGALLDGREWREMPR